MTKIHGQPTTLKIVSKPQDRGKQPQPAEAPKPKKSFFGKKKN